MAIDIQEGDFLVVGSDEYPIRAVADYDAHGFGASPAFGLLASVSCSTKRPPDVAGGKRAAPAEKLTGLSCTPLDPVNPEIAIQMNMRTPYTTKQTFISDGTDYVKLILEDRKA